MTDPVLDVVAVAYEAAAETRLFMRSLPDVGVPFTLTLIDNASPDPAVRHALSDWSTFGPVPEMRAVRTIFHRENIGFARAVNIGVSRGSAPYLAVVNCDVQFVPGAAARLVTTMTEDSLIAVAAPRTTDSAGRLTHSGVLPLGPDGRFQHRFWLDADVGQASDMLDVSTVPGATFFARRTAWEQLTDCPVYRQRIAPEAIGAFLPTRHYFEDTWACVHARAHNWRVVYDGRAKMIHEWDRSAPGEAVGRFHAESRELYLRACASHGIREHGARTGGRRR